MLVTIARWLGRLYLLAWVAVTVQIFTAACNKQKKREDFGEAEKTCAQINARFISHGDCARCRVKKLPNGQMSTYTDSQDCKQITAKQLRFN